jgi:hypothetical protein
VTGLVFVRLGLAGFAPRSVFMRATCFSFAEMGSDLLTGGVFARLCATWLLLDLVVICAIPFLFVGRCFYLLDWVLICVTGFAFARLGVIWFA